MNRLASASELVRTAMEHAAETSDVDDLVQLSAIVDVLEEMAGRGVGAVPMVEWCAEVEEGTALDIRVYGPFGYRTIRTVEA